MNLSEFHKHGASPISDAIIKDQRKIMKTDSAKCKFLRGPTRTRLREPREKQNMQIFSRSSSPANI